MPMAMHFYEDEDSINLINLGGYLCVSCCRGMYIEIWAMMEYGVKESWTILYRVALANRVYDLHTFCFLGGDQLVGMNRPFELLRFNPEGDIIESYVIGRDCLEDDVFVVGLLSPNDYVENDKVQQYMAHTTAV